MTDHHVIHADLHMFAVEVFPNFSNLHMVEGSSLTGMHTRTNEGGAFPCPGAEVTHCGALFPHILGRLGKTRSAAHIGQLRNVWLVHNSKATLQ